MKWLFLGLLLSVTTASAQTPNFGGMVPNASPSASSTPAVVPFYIANNWYLPPGVSTSPAAANPTANSIRIFPFIARKTITLSAIGVRIGATGAAGNISAAIYAADPSTGKPTGTALATAATNMSTVSSGTNVSSALNANLQLQAGTTYWMATNMDNATAILVPVAAIGYEGSWLIGASAQSNNLNGISAAWQGYSTPNTFTGTPMTWPDLTAASFTDVTTANSIPVVQMKVASVP